MVEHSERLRTAMENSGIKAAELARSLGISYQAVKKLCDGTSKSFSAENNMKAAKLLGINPDWLASGQGEMRTQSPSNVSSASGPGEMVPLLSWVQAGQWCASGDALESHAAERWMHCPKPHSNQTFVLRVRGDSMTSTHGRSFPEGCCIFVDGAKRSPVNGECVVACLHHSQESTFKIYKEEDGRRWLQPLNPVHEPMREPFHVLGTVIGKWEDV